MKAAGHDDIVALSDILSHNRVDVTRVQNAGAAVADMLNPDGSCDGDVLAYAPEYH